MLQRPDCFDGRTMEADGQDVRAEPLEERRKRLAKLLSRKTKAVRDGIQLWLNASTRTRKWHG